MSRKLVRGAAVLGTAIVVAALATGGADAVPVPPQRSPEVALPAELVAALERDLHMSPHEYLERAEAAQDVAEYASDLRRSDPAAVGGAWLAADGTPTVAVTTQPAADRVAAAGFRAERVPLSTSGRLMQPTVPEQGKATPPPSFHVASGTTPIGGDAYITTAGPIATTPSFLVCSFGFAAADSAGTPLVLSAGHCDPNRPAAGTDSAAKVYRPRIGDLRNSTLVGDFAASGIGETGGNLDYSVIELTSDAAATTGLVQPLVRGSDGSILTITGTATPVVGAPACKSGQTSGYTCGTVDFADYNTILAGDAGESWSVRGFTTTACTLGGDSGGAIVTGTRALGITSGSNVSHYSDCATAASDNAGALMSFGIPIRAVLARVGEQSQQCVTLRTAANPAGAANGRTCDPEPASTGSSGSLSFGG